MGAPRSIHHGNGEPASATPVRVPRRRESDSSIPPSSPAPAFRCATIHARRNRQAPRPEIFGRGCLRGKAGHHPGLVSTPDCTEVRWLAAALVYGPPRRSRRSGDSRVPPQSSGGAARLPPVQTGVGRFRSQGSTCSSRTSNRQSAVKSYSYRNRSPRWRQKRESGTCLASSSKTRPPHCGVP
jgi:hypothetical protein